MRVRSADRDQSVVARVVNLSASGVFITAPEVPAAGTEVHCRLLLEGHKCNIKGRVAWVRPPRQESDGSRAPGAGISFQDVEAREAELLARAVEPPVASESLVVDVWFEGLRSPIRSHAVIAGEGINISTRLPFLRLNSPVRVSYVRHGVEEQHSGVLDAVVLAPSSDDGIPRLQVTVATGVPEAVQGIIQVPRSNVPVPPSTSSAQLAAAASAHAAPGAIPGSVVDHGTASAESRLIAPIFTSQSGATGPLPTVAPRAAAAPPPTELADASPTLPLTSLAPATPPTPVPPFPPAVAPAAAGGAMAAAPVLVPRSTENDLTPRQRALVEQTTVPPVPLSTPAVVAARHSSRNRVLGFSAIAALVVLGGAGVALRQSRSSAQSGGAADPAPVSAAAIRHADRLPGAGKAAAGAGAPAPKPAASSTAAGTSAERPAAPPPADPAPAAAAAAPSPREAAPARPSSTASGAGVADGLRVVDHSGASTLIIPMHGSAKGVQHFLMEQPSSGVAVNVPNGRPRAGLGQHTTGHGAFKKVVVVKRGATGSQIRVFLLPTLNAAVSADGDGLRITVRPRRNGRRS